MSLTRIACDAMATRFELLLRGADATRLRAAGEEAVTEILGWHRRLSFFDRGSDVSRLNAEAASTPVRVDAELFRLLSVCEECWRISGGAFDPTIGAAMRAAGFREAPRDEESLARVRGQVGFEHVELDRGAGTVRFRVPGLLLDLGAIGKGWALDRAAEVLKEAGVGAAFLHGGTSSVVAFANDGGEAWRVAAGAGASAPVVALRDGALGVSAQRGRKVGEHGHVLDPRTGASVKGLRSAGVVTTDGARADALSTAVLVSGGRVSWAGEGLTVLEEVDEEPGGAWCVYGVSATLDGRPRWAIEGKHEEYGREH